MNGVSSTTALLVTDGSVDGTKARRAAELGTRVVDPETFRDMLSHLQPAVIIEPEAALVRPGRACRPEPATTPAELASHVRVAVTFPEPAAAASEPSPATLRAWGRQNGWVLGDRGRLPKELKDAYLTAHLRATGADVEP